MRISLGKIIFGLTLVALFAMIVPVQNVYAVGFAFDPSINLSMDGLDSQLPKITASGNDVYVVWQSADGDQNIFFTRSTDGGTTFSSPTELILGSTISKNPEIDVSGNNVFIVWVEGTDIVLEKSTDGGVTFSGSPINISNSVTNSLDPKITTSGNNVYVIWSEGDDLFLSSSIDNGVSFLVNKTNVSTSVAFSALNPQIFASAGNNLYVVWEDLFTADIFFRRSLDNGQNFDAAIQLNTAFVASTAPQVVVSGSDVYVIWKEANDVRFARSIDGGATFQPSIDIGNIADSSIGPQLAVSGSNVYALWREDVATKGEIMFSKSSDGGVSFLSPVNLSQNSGHSSTPKLSASGDNVSISWKDDTGGAENIFFVASDDNGVIFSNKVDVSGNSNSASITPEISIVGDNTFIVWDESVGSGDILFATGTFSPILFNFDKTEYKLGETATVSITDVSSNTNSSAIETINSTITSSSDPTGIVLLLTETAAASGIFDASFTFTTDPSSGTSLKADAGDTITSSFSGESGTASIFSRTIDFEFLGSTGNANFDYGHIPSVLVDDQNANINPGLAESITVSVTSGFGDSISLVLPETGADTGMFGGEVLSKLIFMTSNNLFPNTGTVTINTSIPKNVNATAVDIRSVLITSTSDMVGITLDVTETGIDTKLFTGLLILAPSQSIPGSAIKVAPGDVISVENDDGAGTKFITNGLVTPNPNTSNGAIQVDGTADDLVTVHFGGISSSVTVGNSAGGGGGGGGLVRPGLVFNAAGGIGLFGGGGGDTSSPQVSLGGLANIKSFDMPDDVRRIVENHDPKIPISPMVDNYDEFDFPFSIDEDGYILGGFENTLVTRTINTGDPVNFGITFYENSEIQHISLYTNLDGGLTQHSDTEISYDKDGGINLIDPNGKIGDVEFEIVEIDNLTQRAIFKITFLQPMEQSDIILRSWDENRRSSDTIIRDAIEVVGTPVSAETPETQIIVPSENIEDETSEDETSDETTKNVPPWIKSNAKWWSEKQITDNDFVKGIQYLIQEDVMVVPESGPQTTDQSPVMDIPPWVKSNAGWWADDMITEKDFVQGIQYLISNNIITIS